MKELLIGGWNLIDFYSLEGEFKKRWKGSEKGILIYTIDGFVSVAINRQPEIEKLNETDKLRLDFFYSGTYEVNESTVIHKIEFSNIGTLINKAIFRKYTIINNVLILEGMGLGEQVVLKWEKINPSTIQK